MHIIQLLKSVLLLRSNFRNMFRVALVTATFIVFFTGCKKDNISDIQVKPHSNPISLSDSIYFEVDGKVYTSNRVFSTSIGNRGVDMKFSDVPVAGRKSWGSIGNGRNSK